MKLRLSCLYATLGVFVAVALTARLPAADWPVYRADVAHTAASSEKLAPSLHMHWVYAAPEPPQMGWAGEQGRTVEGRVLMHRVTFDAVLQPVVADGRVYFGSSVDHQLHCRDAATGRQLWTFFTGGPIRLAPTIDGGRAYFGSDDGYVYCLDATSGRLLWKLRAGPADESILARGEMVCRWPVRTSVLVDRGAAYFGAGIFPHENVFLYAVNADDGTILWRRDDISQVDAGRDDLSPQGYLLATDELLVVPSGRSLPAAVDRATGKILHKRTHAWRSTAGGVVGGSEALLADGQIYTFGEHHVLAMDQKSGDVGFGYFTGRQMAVTPQDAFLADGVSLSRLDRVAYAEASRRHQKLSLEVYDLSRKLRDRSQDAELRSRLDTARKQLDEHVMSGVRWSVPCSDQSALAVAGDLVITGGQSTVSAHHVDDGRQVFNQPVEGEVRGLAVADGRLYASTTTGKIYCFGPGQVAAASYAVAAAAEPYPADELTALYQAAAQEILDRTGVRRGFCLVLGAEQGRLAYELAKRSELKIYGVESDAAKVEAARSALSAAGLYGHRVTIHHGDPAATSYSNYFANLVVSDSMLLTGQLPAVDPAEVARHVKPLGGTICLGRPRGVAGPAVDADAARTWLDQTRLETQSHRSAADGWATLVRGALPGAGSWTHHYGDPGNTAASDEQRVRGGLGVLWFGDPGPAMMVNRHEGAVGPLAVAGRLFVQGTESVMAYDAYNGQFLWEFHNPDAIRTGVFNNQNPGNLAASEEAVFMFAGNTCVELDAATGQLRRVHRLPPELDGAVYQWGYVAYRGGLLFGTATIRQELAEKQRRRGKVTEDATDVIFAIDLATGNHAWQYQGKSISHYTIAIGPDRVFFIDSSITSDQRAALLQQDKTTLKDLPPEEARAAEERMKRLDFRMAVGLDSRSGRLLWSLPVDVTDCSEIGIGGGKLTLMHHNGVLVLCGANANGHYWPQFVAGDFSRRRLVALSADDGKLLWAKDANYRHRPIIVGDRVIAEPWSFSLYSGEQQMRPNLVTGQPEPWSIMRTGHHCGMITGCENMLFFRSGFTGFYDLVEDVGTRHFAGHRMGCWINAVPANGLVMIPEAGAGCVCLFSIESTIVLEPREPRRPWAIYSSAGAKTPVQHLALNLGAPGDRRDARGTVWIGYPRPKPYRETALEMNLDLGLKFLKDGGYTSLSEDSYPLEGAETPWLFTSAARGLSECRLPLRKAADGPAAYDVTLYLADLEGRQPGQGPFDILLQGRTVESRLDLAKAAGGSGRPLTRVFKAVDVTDTLHVELKPAGPVSTPLDLPILCAIEVRLADKNPDGNSR